MAFRDYGGSGPDLLYLHGAGGTLAEADLLAPHLTRSHRLVAMDIRGHGRSSDGPFGWEACLDDIDVVTATLTLANPAVVGHSLGGMLAVMHGTRHPDVPGVVNMDGHGQGRPDQYDGIAEDVVQMRLAENRKLVDAAVEQLLEAPVIPSEALEHVASATAAAIGVDVVMVRHALQRGMIAAEGGFRPRVKPAFVAAIRDSVSELDFIAVHSNCTAPMLVYSALGAPPPPGGPGTDPGWWDEHWTAFRRGLARGFATLSQRMPNLTFLEIDGPHDFHVENPELVGQQVSSFLAPNR